MKIKKIVKFFQISRKFPEFFEFLSNPKMIPNLITAQLLIGRYSASGLRGILEGGSFLSILFILYNALIKSSSYVFKASPVRRDSSMYEAS